MPEENVWRHQIGYDLITVITVTRSRVLVVVDSYHSGSEIQGGNGRFTLDSKSPQNIIKGAFFGRDFFNFFKLFVCFMSLG